MIMIKEKHAEYKNITKIKIQVLIKHPQDSHVYVCIHSKLMKNVPLNQTLETKERCNNDLK